jgi:hypothetical protein
MFHLNNEFLRKVNKRLCFSFRTFSIDIYHKFLFALFREIDNIRKFRKVTEIATSIKVNLNRKCVFMEKLKALRKSKPIIPLLCQFKSR